MEDFEEEKPAHFDCCTWCGSKFDKAPLYEGSLGTLCSSQCVNLAIAERTRREIEEGTSAGIKAAPTSASPTPAQATEEYKPVSAAAKQSDALRDKYRKAVTDVVAAARNLALAEQLWQRANAQCGAFEREMVGAILGREEER